MKRKLRVVAVASVGLMLLTACSNNEETEVVESPSPTVSHSAEEQPSAVASPSPTSDEVQYVTKTVGGVSFDVNAEWHEYDVSELSDSDLFAGLPGKIFSPSELSEIDLSNLGGQSLILARESAFDDDTVAHIVNSGRNVGSEKLPSVFGLSVNKFSEIDGGVVSHVDLSSPSYHGPSYYGVRNDVGSGVDIIYFHHYLDGERNELLETLKISDNEYRNEKAIYPVSNLEPETEFFAGFDDFEPKSYSKGYVNPLAGVSSRYISLEGDSGYVHLSASESGDSQHIKLSNGNVLGEGYRNEIGKTLSRRPVLLYNVSEGTTAEYVYINSVWDEWSLTLSPISSLPDAAEPFALDVDGHYIIKNDGLPRVVNHDGGSQVSDITGYNKDGQDFPITRSDSFFVLPSGTVWVSMKIEDGPVNFTPESIVTLNNLDVDSLENGVKYQIISDGESVTIPNINNRDLTVVTLEQVKNDPIQKSANGKIKVPFETYLVFLN